MGQIITKDTGHARARIVTVDDLLLISSYVLYIVENIKGFEQQN